MMVYVYSYRLITSYFTNSHGHFTALNLCISGEQDQDGKHLLRLLARRKVGLLQRYHTMACVRDVSWWLRSVPWEISGAVTPWVWFNVQLYIYIYTYVYTYIYTHIYIYTYIYIHNMDRWSMYDFDQTWYPRKWRNTSDMMIKKDTGFRGILFGESSQCWLSVSKCEFSDQGYIQVSNTHRIHVWYICYHLGYMDGKCYHI